MLTCNAGRARCMLAQKGKLSIDGTATYALQSIRRTVYPLLASMAAFNLSAPLYLLTKLLLRPEAVCV